MATLRGLREAAGRTVEQLVAMVGVPAATVSAWEAGRGAPDAHQVGQLALALGVTPEELHAALTPAEAERGE